jgi:S-(hydroxymethyl)glutathione dehydrogenase/alcohol dehydrogenase
MDVRAAVAHGPNQLLRIETLQLRAPKAREVLVELKATGLCHSDLTAIGGNQEVHPPPFPFVPGHEGAGIVREVGPGVTNLKPGDHVILAGLTQCGECKSCVNNLSNLCEKFFWNLASTETVFTLNGQPVGSYMKLAAFASHSVIPEWNLTRVREDAPMDVICYVGCGVATGAGSALFAARVRPGSSVAIFGLGGIGLNIVQGAKLAGAAAIIGIDTNPLREAQARPFGMTHFINPKTLKGSVPAKVNEITEGGADYTFEAVGMPALVRQALECTANGWGVCIIVGAVPQDQNLGLTTADLGIGRVLKTTFLGDTKLRPDFEKLVDWHMEGRLPFDALITSRIPLEEINDGFDMMRRGEGIRAVVVF